MRRRLIPVTVNSFISAPRGDVFDFVADLSKRPAWTDHFQREFHLTRATRQDEKGAGARYRTDPPFGKQLYTDLAIVELDRPRHIVEEGVQGKVNATRVQLVWDFSEEGAHHTRVSLEMRTEPGSRLARMSETGAHGYYKRNWKTALERLRKIFEERPEGELARASIAGFEPMTAPRYG
jgi:uncharacterized protein YndB with AHSA1/START domain